MYAAWLTIWEDPGITECIDPLTDCILEKAQFQSVYRPILEQIDGRDYAQSVEFFFCPCPTTPTCITFVDQEAKDDFVEWAVEAGILPSLKDIHAGEHSGATQEREFLELADLQDAPAPAPSPTTLSSDAPLFPFQ